MNDKLQLIREKCIAANPEIRHRTAMTSVASLTVLGHDVTIRLADVLIAISVRYKGPDFAAGGYAKIAAMLDREKAEKNLLFRYNLRADDLEKQSPETINFLYELLK